jgi:hypothetical protein
VEPGSVRPASGDDIPRKCVTGKKGKVMTEPPGLAGLGGRMSKCLEPRPQEEKEVLLTDCKGIRPGPLGARDGQATEWDVVQLPVGVAPPERRLHALLQ